MRKTERGLCAWRRCYDHKLPGFIFCKYHAEKRLRLTIGGVVRKLRRDRSDIQPREA